MPDIPEHLSAIVHDDRYYSLFKTVDSAEESLDFASKASTTGNPLAMTQSGERYMLWVHEAEAVLVQPEAKPKGHDRPAEALTTNLGLPTTFSSAPCLIVADSTQCQFCHLAIPGCHDRVPGFEYQHRYYQLVQQEVDARTAIAAIAERACRGDELAMILTPNNYNILALEPFATPWNLVPAPAT